MDTKKLFLGIAILVLAVSVTAAPELMCARDNSCGNNDCEKDCSCNEKTCAKKVLWEGVMVGDKFKKVNDRAFDSSESVFLDGKGYIDVDKVDIYVTVNRKWKCGDDVNQIGYVKKYSDISTHPFELGKFSNGYYDVFVDENGNGKFDCCKDGECCAEKIDGRSFKTFGFEVLPEMATALLLGAGLVSMVGYVSIKKR